MPLFPFINVHCNINKLIGLLLDPHISHVHLLSIYVLHLLSADVHRLIIFNQDEEKNSEDQDASGG